MYRAPLDRATTAVARQSPCPIADCGMTAAPPPLGDRDGPSDAGTAGSGATVGLKVVPPALYAVPLLVGIALNVWQPLPVSHSGSRIPVGIALLVVGLIGVPAMRSFRKARTSPLPWKPTTALVTDGPYRFTRNPMYVGFTLLYLAGVVLANSAWPLFALPVILLVMQRAVIAKEEAYLERLFGEDYRRYRGRVRRWI
jgi:protein-S-isoprenylcysteine O-methyltransferase Ste14